MRDEQSHGIARHARSYACVRLLAMAMTPIVVALAVVASHTLHRFLLQRQPAKEFLKYFLDLHMSTAQQARRPGPMHSPGQWPRLL